MKKMTTSLIISTYNWPRALELCLESVMRQRIMPDEIIIADDGSGAETRQVIERFERLSPVPLCHVWHPDDGFRLAAIRNKAIAAASGDYIIQIDGDVILERHFVQDHKIFARKGYFVSGTRGRTTEELLPKLMSGEVKHLSPLSAGLSNRHSVMRIPLLRMIYPLLGFKRRGKGCNMAFWREDTIKVNGYDESFKGWGCEDIEMQARLENTGIRFRLLHFGGIQYHIFHKETDPSNRSKNNDRFQRSQSEKLTRCEKGIDQHLGQKPSLYPASSTKQ